MLTVLSHGLLTYIPSPTGVLCHNFHGRENFCLVLFLLWLVSMPRKDITRSIRIRLWSQDPADLVFQPDTGLRVSRKDPVISKDSKFAVASIQIKLHQSSKKSKDVECHPRRGTSNMDDAPIVSKSHTHPSHSQTSRLLTSSVSLGVRVPLGTQCIRGV